MKSKIAVLFSLLMVASMLLAACGGAADPGAAAEEPVVEAPFVAKTLSAADCDSTGIIKSVEATDQYTVTFTLCQSDPAFLSKIAFSPFAIYPEEWIERTAGEESRTSEGLEKPIGTGPYMVAEWKRGESVDFKAFEGYWGEQPQAETLVLRWQSEAAARLLELQSGTIDGIDNLGPADFEVVAADSNLTLVERPALNIFYIGMTNTFAPYDDVRVRQAIAYGIDQQRIVDNFYPAGSEKATHFTPCAIPNACVGDSWYEFNPAMGRELLSEAGFPDGFATKIYYRDVVRGDRKSVV